MVVQADHEASPRSMPEMHKTEPTGLFWEPPAAATHVPAVALRAADELFAAEDGLLEPVGGGLSREVIESDDEIFSI